MATDGVKIIDGDNAFDLYNVIMDMYDEGVAIPELKERIRSQYDIEGQDAFDEEIYLTVFALAMWEIGELDDELLNRVREIIESERGLKEWAEEDEYWYAPRKRVLHRFLKKIQTPPARLRKRKPNKPVRKLVFNEGDCLTLTLPDGHTLGFVVCEILQKQNKCVYKLMFVALPDATQYTLESFRSGSFASGRYLGTSTLPSLKDLEFSLDVAALKPTTMKTIAPAFELIGSLPLRKGTYSTWALYLHNSLDNLIETYTRHVDDSKASLIPMEEIIATE
jgi:hypothetical protein